MKYLEKKFSTFAPTDETYRNNWDTIFGNGREQITEPSPYKMLADAAETYCSAKRSGASIDTTFAAFDELCRAALDFAASGAKP